MSSLFPKIINNLIVGAEWVDNFPPKGEPCNQVELTYRQEHADDFCNIMQYEYGADVAFNWGDGNAWETDWRSNDYGGDSLDWTDNVNIMYWADHGGNTGSMMNIAFASQNQSCISWSDTWKLGAKNLQLLVLDCCQCVQESHPEQAAQWFTPNVGLFMICGFVGDSFDSFATRWTGLDFAIAASQYPQQPISSAWLDAAFDYNADVVPIAIAFGRTEEEATALGQTLTLDYLNILGCINIHGRPTPAAWVYWVYRHP